MRIPKISIISAVDQGYVIGCDGKIPWKMNREDMRIFREKTIGKAIVMGRATAQSISRFPLEKRFNIVLTSKPENFQGSENLIYVDSLEDTILEGIRRDQMEIVGIGGEQVYRQMLPIADEMHLSFFKGYHQGDRKFPEVDFREWEIVESTEFNDFTYRRFQRRINPIERIISFLR